MRALIDNVPWDIHRFSHRAMATVFEAFIIHPDCRYAEQAASAAFAELDRMEQEISRFIENSDVARVNNLTPGQSLPIGPDLFHCLKLATCAHLETNGAFDVTIGAVLDCWSEALRGGHSPRETELAHARQRAGMHRILLDEAHHTIQLRDGPVQIDLGGIGKGYGLDRMAALLHDWDVNTVLLHAGNSSVLALTSPPDTNGWPVALARLGAPEKAIAQLVLHDRALGASGLEKGRHIIDPRRARPVEGKRATWVSAPTAAEADALSTAFMVMTIEEIRRYCGEHLDIQAIVDVDDAQADETALICFGRWERIAFQSPA